MSGGTWNPASPIIVGGAGMWFCGPTVMSGALCIENALGTGDRIVHGDNDWIELGNPYSAGITKATSLGLGRDASYSAIADGCTPRFVYSSGQDGIVNYEAIGAGYVGKARITCPVDVHEAAKITSITIAFKVGQPHANPPAVPPQVGLFQVDGAGNVTPLLTSAAGGMVSFPTYATGTLWYDGGAVQTFLVNLPGGGVVVDTSQYTYFMTVIDEQGAHAESGNIYLGVKLGFGVSDMRPQ